MKTTGEFHLHSFPIHTRAWNRPFYIAPIGDIHWGAPHCAADMFRRDLRTCIDNPDCYLLGMGDYFEHISTSERETLRGRMHESFRRKWETELLEEVDELCELMAPMKERIIGLVEGNHYGELKAGITTTQLMCQKLGCRYLGVMSLTLLDIKVGTKSPQTMSLTICAHHGTGASRLTGGSINSVEKLQEVAEADIYAMGHDHKKVGSRTAKLQLKWGRKRGLYLQDREMVSLRSGTYLRGYVDGEVCYIAEVAGRPSVLGHPLIQVTPTTELVDGVRDYSIRYSVSNL